MEKKFYAVTTGSYSDYHIITITDSEQRAEHIAEIYDAEVETYIDEGFSETKPFVFYVWRNGLDVCARYHGERIPNDREENVIYRDTTEFAYVRATSRKEALEKAGLIFADLVEKPISDEQKRKNELEKKLRQKKYWLIMRNASHQFDVSQQSYDEVQYISLNTVICGIGVFVEAEDNVKALKIACDVFARYDAMRAGI